MPVYNNSILRDAISYLHSTGHSQRWNDENQTEPWLSSTDTLISQSTLQDFTIGTGRTIFTSSILPAILSARHEVILATCFWAPGPTLDELTSTLKQLSDRISSEGNRNKVKIYICLSSRSLLQKLFHTSSPNGYIYPPESWKRQLGLPCPSEIPGLELRAKSLFFRPFSILHSKCVIIDRQDVWLPSCNISWEEWYECCIHLQGAIVDQVFTFWKQIWDHNNTTTTVSLSRTTAPNANAAKLVLPTTLLPHPHHTSWRHNNWLLHTLRTQQPPATPLTTTLQYLFTHAQKSITLLTPNLTSAPVYNALLSALARGVDIRLITNRKMMILEQLLTSGSLSEWWVWRLRREYGRLLHQQSGRNGDVEDGPPHLGVLRIEYFAPASNERGSNGNGGTAEIAHAIAARTAKSHVKLTIIDSETVVLGSGNMDRASWYTSQELGIMLEGREGVGRIWDRVEAGLEGCLEVYC